MKEDKKNAGLAIILGGVFIGGIAAIFWGMPGFIIGGVVGALLVAGNGDESDQEKGGQAAPLKDSEGQEDGGTASTTGFEAQAQYIDAMIALVSGCMVADGKVEQSEIEMANSLIKNDDLITDKKSAIERVHIKVRELFSSRKESKAAFNLKISADLNRISNLTDPALRERLLLVLDGMIEALNGADSPDTESFREKVSAKLSLATASKSKQEAAETWILNSGDKDAIQALKQMKADPGSYHQTLKKGARNNTVLKTALGVFTGYIAADLVTSAIYQHQLQQALEGFEAELAGNWELEGMDLGDISSADLSNEPETNDMASGFEPEGMEVASEGVDDIENDFDSDGFDFFS